jgi:hypothetical protein
VNTVRAVRSTTAPPVEHAAMEEAERRSGGRQEAKDRAPNRQARAPFLDHGEGTEQNWGGI